MGILFRYTTHQIIISTTFITCGLVCFVWLGQSLRFIEVIVRHHVGLFTYFQLVLYLLPDLLAGLLPIGLALGTATTLRNLEIHHEWRAMQAMGLNPWLLFRPFGWVSIVICALTFISSNEIAPWAFKQLKKNEFALKSQWTPALSGSFQSVKGVTVYIQEQTKEGTLKDIFIDAPPQTFMAESGTLIKQGNQFGCHLHAGHRLEKHADGTITQMDFDDIFYDFSSFTEQHQKTEQQKQTIKPSEKKLQELIWPPEDASAKEIIKMKSEGHQRLLQAFLVLLDVLIVYTITSALKAGLLVGGLHLAVLSGLPFVVSVPWLVVLPYSFIFLALGITYYRLWRGNI